jgi:hypothetical protein
MTTLGGVPNSLVTAVKRAGIEDGIAKSAVRERIPVEGERLLVPEREAVAIR